jgi:hypothetical protein
MQHDEHVWAWRWQRFCRTGLMLGMLEIGAAGPEYRYIDPAEYYRW